MPSFSSTPFSSKKTKRPPAQTPQTPGWSLGLFGTGGKTPAANSRTSNQESDNLNNEIRRFNLGSPSPWRQQRSTAARAFHRPQPQIDLLDRTEARAPTPREDRIVPAAAAAASCNNTNAATEDPLPTKKRPHVKVGLSSMWMSRGTSARPHRRTKRSGGLMSADLIKQLTAAKIIADASTEPDSSLISMSVGKCMNARVSRLQGTKRFKAVHFSEPDKSQDGVETSQESATPPTLVDKAEDQPAEISLDPPYRLGAIPEPSVGTAAGATPKGLVLINPGTVTADAVKGIVIPPPVAVEDDSEEQAQKTVWEPDYTDTLVRKWTCPHCGHDDNTDDQGACTKCGKGRGGSIMGWGDLFKNNALTDSSNKWKCLSCLALNPEKHTKCEACEVPRGQNGEQKEHGSAAASRSNGCSDDASAGIAAAPTFAFLNSTPAPASDTPKPNVTFGFKSAPAPAADSSKPAIKFGFTSSSAPAPAPSQSSMSSFGSSLPPAPAGTPSGQAGFNFGTPAPAAVTSSGQAGFNFGTPAPAAATSSGQASSNFGASAPAAATSSGQTGWNFGAPAPTSQSSGQNSTGFKFETPAPSTTHAEVAAKTDEEKKSDAPTTLPSSPTFASADAPSKPADDQKGKVGTPTFQANNGDKLPSKSPSSEGSVPTDPLTGKPLSSAEAASLSQFGSGGEQERKKKRRGRDRDADASSTNGKRSALGPSASNGVSGSPPFQFRSVNESSMPNGMASETKDSKRHVTFQGSSTSTAPMPSSQPFQFGPPAADTGASTPGLFFGSSSGAPSGGPTFGQSAASDSAPAVTSNASSAPFVFGSGRSTTPAPASDAAPAIGSASGASSNPFGAAPTPGTEIPASFVTGSGLSTGQSFTPSASVGTFGTTNAPTSGAPFGSNPGTSTQSFGQPPVSGAPTSGWPQAQSANNGQSFGSAPAPTPGTATFGASSAPANAGFATTPTPGAPGGSVAFNGQGPSTFGTTPNFGAPAPGPFGLPPPAGAPPPPAFGAPPAMPTNSFGQVAPAPTGSNAFGQAAAPQASGAGGFNLGVGKQPTKRRIVRARRPK